MVPRRGPCLSSFSDQREYLVEKPSDMALNSTPHCKKEEGTSPKVACIINQVSGKGELPLEVLVADMSNQDECHPEYNSQKEYSAQALSISKG